MANKGRTSIIYREKLFPSINTTMALLMPVPIAWLAAYPFHPYLGLAIGAAFASIGYALLWVNSPVIEVSKDALAVGAVTLPLAEVGAVSVHRGTEAQLQRGPQRVADAFVVLRGTASKLVKIELNSKIDKTPYWLVGTRNPEVLVQAIERSRT